MTTVQIFRKDIERLWWVVLLTLALLVLFAYQDTTRTINVLPVSATNNGWLNLALPFAWSLLIALVIVQDPLAGDRQFWVSLPCGWQSLLAAKTAFVAAFIQLPYLLATAAILLAKGFNPLQHIPHLLWKQLVLLALILPAVAVAAVVKNIAHFLLVVITIAGGVILMSNRLNSGYGSDTSWDVRWDLTLLILVIGALSVAILQFARRYTLHSRVIGIATAVAAFSLYNWLPRDASAAIRAAISPAHSTPIAVTIGSRALTLSEQQRYSNRRQTMILIPLEFSGLGSNVRLDQISFELTSANAEHYEAQWPHSSDDVRSQRITADLDMLNYGRRSAFQRLALGSAEIAKRLLSGPVTIKGRMLARFYRPGQSTTLRPVGRTDVPGLGYCMSSAPLPTGREDTLLTFECDSPELTSREMLANGRSILRDRVSFGPSHYPEDPWLSPLHRGTFADSWPKNVPPPSRLNTVAPAISVGNSVIDYTFSNVDLNRFLVPEAHQ